MVAEQDQAFQEERLQYHLQIQANQIQKVLNHHGASSTITGGIASKRSFRFNLRSPINTGFERLLSLKEELKKALGVSGIRFSRQEGQLQLQVLRPFSPAVPLLDLMSRLDNIPLSTAILGFADDGTVVQHDFSVNATPNILISGEKDAGKTILLRSIAASLALANRQADTQLVAINPISTDSQRRDAQAELWRPLNYIPHMLTDVVSRQSEITELMLFLVREMNYRSEHLFNGPRIVIFIDQAATVMERGGRTVTEAIMRIAERGAVAGIHIVLGTRRPRSSHFSPHLLANLQSRHIGRGSQDSIWVDDEKMILKASSLLGEGDFLTHGLSRPVRFQAAYIDDYDLHMGLSKLYRRRPILLAQPVSNRIQMNSPFLSAKPEQQQFAFSDSLIAVS